MRARRTLVLPLLLAAPLAACSGQSDEALRQQTDELQSDVRRLGKDNDKLREQLSAAQRRIEGLEKDVAHIRELTVSVQQAPAPESKPSAAADGKSGAPGDAAGATGPIATQIKAALATDEGRKIVADALTAVQEQQRLEQQQRMVDAMVDRFAKTANLTDDQTKKMKEIMGNQAAALRDARASMRDLPPDATQDQRDQARQQMVAKVDDVRKQTDDQVKAVLSQTQYEQYQQEQDRIRTGMRGFGPGGFGGGQRGQ